MGIFSWLFPSDADRLQTARALMGKGRWGDARRGLVHCKSPEAEALYEECSRHLDDADKENVKRRARAQGFRGWKVEVTTKDPRGRAQLEAFITKELVKAGVDLDTPEIDQEAVKAVLARAEQKARNKGISGGAMKLVPVMAEQRS